MVVGYGVHEGDMIPLDLPGGSIDWVNEFPYLGSLITESGMAHVLKITSLQQLEECLSSAQVRKSWSDRDTIDTIIMRRHLRNIVS